jgi:hypothetical protein
MKRFVKGFSLCVALALVAVCAWMPAFANDGLGASVPNTANVSANAQYQVFRWNLAGVEYVQVNDLSGNVLFAVEAVGGVVVAVPVGTPSNVQVVTAATNAANGGAAVYSDANVTITVAAGAFYASPGSGSTSSSGTTVQPEAQPVTCTNPSDCSYIAG